MGKKGVRLESFIYQHYYCYHHSWTKFPKESIHEFVQYCAHHKRVCVLKKIIRWKKTNETPLKASLLSKIECKKNLMIPNSNPRNHIQYNVQKETYKKTNNGLHKILHRKLQNDQHEHLLKIKISFFLRSLCKKAWFVSFRWK